MLSACNAIGGTMSELLIKRDEKKAKIWSHVRSKWLVETPEETVRQEYLLILVNEYGFSIDQIAEELDLTGRGSASARADFVIWRTTKDKADDNAPFIIVECKSNNVTIKPHDYSQGENYSRICGAPFFVTHNSRETRYWRVKKDKVPGYTEEIENIPHGDASDKDIEELLSKLRVFKEKEFADLLHQCHNVIRNREKKDPAAAFDEIAKVLFIKVYVERQLLTRRSKENLFTVDVLKRQISENPLDNLFQETKRAYATDKIFEDDERINLKPATGEEIVRRLEKYNLSDTSEDVKGVAFERFLGRTFRGEIGQFFTPRSIVEFMVHMVDPQEGEIVCDPASGSGGFLIRVFEIVREKILADADREYNVFKAEVEADTNLKEEQIAKKLKDKYSEIQDLIDQKRDGSRLWKLSNRCIYGTDANDRMARTSKMNMIMHGDGHGGVHHHDGFLNVNGIFEGRFDIILTNPPFGANVEPSDKVLEVDIAVNPLAEERYLKEYGELYREAQNRVKAALNKPIASLFNLPKSEKSKIKTEVLFIERCLDLLKPGGRLGIVLPEGIFNNPSLAYVREFTENRAFLRAVVSLPQETFVSSGASVKCSLLFMQKFSEEEQQHFDDTYATARIEIEEKYADKIVIKKGQLEAAIDIAKKDKDTTRCKARQQELNDYFKEIECRQISEARQLLKEYIDYPIFMYVADKVGITATGLEDDNELFSNPRFPPTLTASTLESYRDFLVNRDKYLIELHNTTGKYLPGKIDVMPPTPRKGPFAIMLSDLERWNTFFYRVDFVDLERQFSAIKSSQLGDILQFESRPWKKNSFEQSEFRYIEISSVTKEEGITGAPLIKTSEAPSRATTLVKSGDIIISTTRPYLGAFAIVTDEYNDCVCSSGFSLATGLRRPDVEPEYLLLFLKSEAGLRQMERRMTGGLYPAIVQAELEKIKVPIPPIQIQKNVIKAVIEGRKRIKIELEKAKKKALDEMQSLDSLVLAVNYQEEP